MKLLAKKTSIKKCLLYTSTTTNKIKYEIIIFSYPLVRMNAIVQVIDFFSEIIVFFRAQRKNRMFLKTRVCKSSLNL